MLDGYQQDQVIFACCSFQGDATVDFQGNLIFCCNMTHITQGDGKPGVFGAELLADLKQESLQEGMKRHFQLLGQLMAARLAEVERLNDLTYHPCYWCLKYFGKFEWLHDFPDSPWTKGLFSI
jgi:hypothetical protein